MKLIDKSALVAEIEKLQLCTMDEHMNFYSVEAQGDYNALSKLESFLDTLEVKEVDLEKCYHDFLQKEWFDKNCNRTMSEIMAFTAKHFFELGLKAQKGE
jgi:hypothetical protein